jgi:hypothetical protein
MTSRFPWTTFSTFETMVSKRSAKRSIRTGIVAVNGTSSGEVISGDEIRARPVVNTVG